MWNDSRRLLLIVCINLCALMIVVFSSVYNPSHTSDKVLIQILRNNGISADSVAYMGDGVFNNKQVYIYKVTSSESSQLVEVDPIESKVVYTATLSNEDSVFNK